MTDQETRTQVLVVGGGNAALAAAVSAREQGADVLVLEKAPKAHRGGNSALTVHMRFPYAGMQDLIHLMPDTPEEEMDQMAERISSYTQQQYWDDIMTVTEGLSDKTLAERLVTEAFQTIQWMRGHGHKWQPTYRSPISANVVSFAGGGYNLTERWFETAQRMGIKIRYDTRAMELKQNAQGHVIGVHALDSSGFHTYLAGSVILACGSFESSPEMRAKYLGTGWDTVKLRGIPFNTGDGLEMALDIGALPYGSWSTCHASPQDFNRPAYDLPGPGVTGDFWSRYAYPFSVMVNLRGHRFVDEGETWRGLTYAKMGRAILAQPQARAFQIFDAKHRNMDLLRSYDKAEGISANTLEELGTRLGLWDIPTFISTIQEYNGAVQPGEFDPFKPDGKSTIGIEPERRNWALELETPPFEAFPVTCGMTFCYGGLKITGKGEVLHTLDRTIPGLYTAGEMVGGLWAWNYPSGGGMMAGAVFGRIAGSSAAEFSQS